MKHLIRKKIRKEMNRSGKAQCDICRNKHILIRHHIDGHNIPNAEHSSNIANICDNDHRLIHEGKIIIEKWFVTSNGRELLWHYANETSFSGQNSKPHIIG